MKTRQTIVPLPSRAETLSRLEALAEGRLSREEASDWAVRWIIADEVPGTDVLIDDWGVWRALGAIAGADMHGGDRPYLYAEQDFIAWAEELRIAPVQDQ